jgi:hypothetical protein
VLSSSQPLVFEGGRHAAGYTVIVRAGRVDIDVPEKSPSAVVLAMPRQTSAIIQSGSVRAAASPGKVAVANVRGTTNVAIGSGAYKALPSGAIAEADGKQHAMIAAPAQVKGSRVWFSSPAADSGHDFSWAEVTGASRYRVALKDEKDGHTVATSDTRETHVSGAFSNATAGSYELSISSIDENGIESPKSFSTPVRVIGTELPEGAYTDSKGAIRLGKRQQIQFVGTNGLEVTYGGGGRFFKAPKEVGLIHNDETLVHFRFPGSFEVATVHLTPRTVIAEVEVGPKTVTWPENPVEIRIRLRDPSGEPVPSWMEAKPRVTLGVQRLDVTFRNVHGGLSAKVSPKGGGGPWVMRVEVSDQFGIPLGRDFVEIVRGPSKSKVAIGPVPARADQLSKR